MDTAVTLSVGEISVVFGAGCLIGFVFSMLLGLKSLKSLKLDVHRIGFSLGVEGFEEKSTGIQVSVSGKGNTTNVAGRDINSFRASYTLANALAASSGSMAKEVRNVLFKYDFRTTLDDVSNFFGRTKQAGMASSVCNVSARLQWGADALGCVGATSP